MNNNFDIVLDTNPMAESVDTVSQHVKGVTGAVVAMQSAVIHAEKEASRKICENVDLGFYILMASQLSQKMALCSSQISSHLLRMQKFRSDILSVQTAMQNDYARISSRYFKLFNSLDKNLEQRIKALDADAVRMSKTQSVFLSQTRDDSASFMLVSSDGQIMSQKAIIAKIKSKTARAISVLGNEVEESLEYKESVEHTLTNKQIENTQYQYIPVIICESESVISKDNFVKTVFVPENKNLYSFKEVKNVVQDAELKWQTVNKNEASQVKAYFEKAAKDESIDERVLNEMMRLFNENEWQTTVLEGDNEQ